MRRCLGPGLFRVQHLGRAAPKLFAALLFSLSSLLQFLFGRLLCSLGVLPCLLLQCRFGFGDLLEPAFPPRQFAAQFIAPHPLAMQLVFRGIDFRRLRQQFFHLRFQLLLLLLHAPVTHRLVFTRVGLQLCAVNRHMPQLDQSRFATQLKHLREQPCQDRQVLLAELSNGVVIGVLVRRQIPKGQIVVGGALDPSGTHHSQAISV